jgi:hypothetical protein
MFQPFSPEFIKENEHNCDLAEEIFKRKEKELVS